MPSKNTKIIRINLSDYNKIEMYSAHEGISMMEALSIKLNQASKTPPLYDEKKGVWICPFCMRQYLGKTQIITHFQEVELNK